MSCDHSKLREYVLSYLSEDEKKARNAALLQKMLRAANIHVEKREINKMLYHELDKQGLVKQVRPGYWIRDDYSQGPGLQFAAKLQVAVAQHEQKGQENSQCVMCESVVEYVDEFACCIDCGTDFYHWCMDLHTNRDQRSFSMFKQAQAKLEQQQHRESMR